jgi:hypothetical protein
VASRIPDDTIINDPSTHCWLQPNIYFLCNKESKMGPGLTLAKVPKIQLQPEGIENLVPLRLPHLVQLNLSLGPLHLPVLLGRWLRLRLKKS